MVRIEPGRESRWVAFILEMNAGLEPLKSKKYKLFIDLQLSLKWNMISGRKYRIESPQYCSCLEMKGLSGAKKTISSSTSLNAESPTESGRILSASGLQRWTEIFGGEQTPQSVYLSFGFFSKKIFTYLLSCA